MMIIVIIIKTYGDEVFMELINLDSFKLTEQIDKTEIVKMIRNVIDRAKRLRHEDVIKRIMAKIKVEEGVKGKKPDTKEVLIGNAINELDKRLKVLEKEYLQNEREKRCYNVLERTVN